MQPIARHVPGKRAGESKAKQLRTADHQRTREWKRIGVGAKKTGDVEGEGEGEGEGDRGSGMADVKHECMETTKQAMTECRHKRGA